MPVVVVLMMVSIISMGMAGGGHDKLAARMNVIMLHKRAKENPARAGFAEAKEAESLSPDAP